MTNIFGGHVRPVLCGLLLPFAACSSSDTGGAADTPDSDIAALTRTMLDGFGVDGAVVVVVRDDEVLMAEGFGQTQENVAYDARTPVIAYSATKALSAFTYASLVEDGAFDVDAPLGAYLDDAPAAWREIPFWRLLNHTSGITMITNRPEFGEMDADPTSSNEDIYRVVRELPLDHEPGEASLYRQSGWAVAEMIVEREVGATWPELVEEHVTGPAGASDTGHGPMLSGARSVPLLTSAGWYQTTASDMAAIFQALNAGAVVDLGFLAEFLHRGAYDFEGYGLGSIRQDIDGIRTVGHRGGGARATIRYAPAERLGVAVFTDQEDTSDFAEHLANALIRSVGLGQDPALPVEVALLPLAERPADEIIAAYEAAAAESDRYDFGTAEAVLNRLGYGALGRDDAEEAVRLMELSVREHPESANAHDSLGEAYLAAGRLDEARASYRRALELSPDSRNPVRMLERIDSLSAI